MANTLLVRPHMVMVALRNTPVRLFSRRPCLDSAVPPSTSHLTSRPLFKLSENTHETKHSACSSGYGPKLDTRRSLSIRATTQVNGPGSIDSPLIQSMEKKIKEHLNAELVNVKDAYGDGRHVSIDVISSAFEGQSAVSRQRMVYRAIWEELQSTVHAVDQMTTRTPVEAAGGK